MPNFLKLPHRHGFRPESTEGYLALQRARQVGKSHAVEHQLVALAQGGSSTIPSGGLNKLCAIKVQRREIAVAVFSGLKLDFVQERHFPADPVKAESSALGFLHWVLENLDVESAAIEQVARDAALRRSQLTDSMRVALRSEALPLCEPSKKELLTSFAVPEPKTRKEVRQIVCGIWPILQTMQFGPAILDAVALGLYAQAQRLLIS